MSVVSEHTPRVTVLMPVYNGGLYLAEAVGSILGQTFRDLELLVINDGSTDKSADIMATFADPRIRYVENDGNRGLIATLNKGLALAQGEYVARMDCDDISHPRRLERQVALLDGDPAIGICGAWIRKFGAVRPKVCRYHTRPELLRCGLLFDPVLAHPAVMLRRTLFLDNGLNYDPQFKDAEDYELWSRAGKLFRLGNVAEVLLEYRIHRSQISQLYNREQLAAAGRVRRSLLDELGLDPSPEEFDIHQRISTYAVSGCDRLFQRADDWLCRIREANLRVRRYPEPELSLVLAERLATLLKKQLENRIVPDCRAFRPELLRVSRIGWHGIALFMVKSFRGEVHGA